MKIAVFEGGYDRNFGYLIWCPGSRRAALIDAATEVAPIQAALQERGLKLTYLLLTHTHGDHLAYLTDWVGLYPQLEVAGHARPLRGDLSNYRGLSDNAEVNLGNCRLNMLVTPGHYPDCVCWYDEAGGVLFTGDTVFIGRTGRTIGPLSSTPQLYRSLATRILPLPPETVIYPGHNYGPTPTATLAELQATSDFFRCATEAQFRDVMTRYERERRPGD
ncbi:MAG: MBL fold metallo-hydrolase [Candidatus Marinimicrobia bacterium]|nr:MBL fold metallo-hydrolase [Candidatus Neomarinimicrobiota bacterium]